MIKKSSRLGFYGFALVFFVFLLVISSSLALSAKPLVNPAKPSTVENAWPMNGRNAKRQAATSELILPSLSPLWTKTFPYGDLSDQPPRYIVARGKLFAIVRSGDQTKNLLALDPMTGAEIWSRGYLNGRDFQDMGYDETTEHLYAMTPSEIVSIDPSNGFTINQFSMPSECTGGSLAIVEGNLYVASCQRISKINSNGNILWSYSIPVQTATLRSLAVGNGIVYANSEGWTLQAFNADSGQKIWESPTNGMPYTLPVIGDGLVFQGCQGKGAYSSAVLAYDALTGQIKWGVVTGYGGTVDTPMSYSDGVLYFGSKDQNIYAVDTRTPKLLWSYETPDDISSPVVLMGNVIYAVSGCGTGGGLNAALYALDAATGTLLSQETVPCSGLGLVPYQGTLFVNSRTWNTGTLLKAYATQEGYHMAIMPNQVTARPGEQTQTQLRISSTFHFTETVQLSASSVPNGISLALSAWQSPPSGTITLTLSLSSTLQLRGSIPITITGTTMASQKLAPMKLTVLDPLPAPKYLFLPIITR